MKVTVCFGEVRVVVPCGDGSGSVRDLMVQAATRYSKATGWPNDSWVTVHSLKTAEGGLLDPDDRLSDVADDREQIVAVFEDARAGAHGGGDGRSASSDGTPSPVQNGDHGYQQFSRVDIEVTGDQEHTCSLQVRRGSEPALNQIAPLPQFPSPAVRDGDTSKRWSAAPVIDDDLQRTPVKAASCDPLTPPGERGEPSGDERDRLTLPRLARDTNRLSMQILGNSDSAWRWADAADRLMVRQQGRQSPVDPRGDRLPPEEPEADSQLVILSDITGPLGMHVVPDGERGVLVQRVEPDGAVGRDGRIRPGDRISQVNGHHLAGCDLQRAQELFTMAMSRGELRLSVRRPSPGQSQRPPPAPVYPGSRSHTPVDGIAADDKGGGSRVATVTPTKKVPASLSSRTQTVMLTSNTRKLGRRLTLRLTKGAAGLGFSVTTRDNPAGGHAPVYVKNILPKGAAVEDGRLRPGDRLLEIDGAEVTGLSQQQVVQVLRAVQPGQQVHLVLSRHEQADARAKTPDDEPAAAGSPNRSQTDVSSSSPEAKPEPAEPPSQESRQAEARQPEPAQAETRQAEPADDREVLTFDISVRDSETGLGVSVKGRPAAGKAGQDAGIYIKSVIEGGAASRDGRLRHNDHLVSINGSSLAGLANSQAMETLRHAMAQQGPRPGVVTLTVARRRDPLAVSSATIQSAGSTGDERSVSSQPEVTISHRLASSALPVEPPPPAGRNPVIDRLTGCNNARSDTYYQAAPSPWSDGRPEPQQQQRPLAPVETAGDVPRSALAPTVNMPSGDTVLIEPDPPPASLSSQLSDANTDVDYASQTSLEQAGLGFTRDQVGRQSISEKRHASKDAKSTDTYQRTKRAREEREQRRREIEAQLSQDGVLENGRSASQHSLTHPDPARPPRDVGPSLGMKKSSSLESLQTMVHELALAEEEDRPYHHHRGPVKVVRGRGCNESFRAAVDRSHEAPLGEKRTASMDTLDEESGGVDGGDPLFIRDRTVRQSSLSTGAVEGKKSKRRSGGLLKGLGSMFRFGRHRKTSDPVGPSDRHRLTAEEMKAQQDELNRIAARRRAEDEQRRIQHQYQRLVQQQQQQQQSREQSPPPPPPPRTAVRSERIQELREQHQRRQAGRQQQQAGYRPDSADPLSRQRMEEGGPPLWPSEPAVRRPASRTGGPEPYLYPYHGAPDDYAHRRHQPSYHSQRSGRGGEAAEYYEYESVQAVMRLGGGGGGPGYHPMYSARSLPRHHERIRDAALYSHHGMRPSISAGPGGSRRTQHLGIPVVAHGRRGPPRPPPLSPPGSRV